MSSRLACSADSSGSVYMRHHSHEVSLDRCCVSFLSIWNKEETALDGSLLETSFGDLTLGVGDRQFPSTRPPRHPVDYFLTGPTQDRRIPDRVRPGPANANMRSSEPPFYTDVVRTHMSFSLFLIDTPLFIVTSTRTPILSFRLGLLLVCSSGLGSRGRFR